MEIVLSHDKNAYRVIYAISSKVISVLHAFQKKSKKGASTPRLQIEMIKRRLTVVQEYSNE
jgi:phage-related protein